jgi:hypothetical protein
MTTEKKLWGWFFLWLALATVLALAGKVALTVVFAMVGYVPLLVFLLWQPFLDLLLARRRRR